MQQRSVPITIIILISIFFSTKIFALTNTQEELAKKFFEQVASDILLAAHPTGKYLSSKATISANTVYLEIQFTGFVKQRTLKVSSNIGSDNMISDLTVESDTAKVKPFLAADLAKKYFIDNKKADDGMLTNLAKDSFKNLNAQDITSWWLKYKWVKDDFQNRMK